MRNTITQADLFDVPLLPGLGYRDSFITAAEELALIAAIDRAGLSPFRFQQWTGKRLTPSFGWNYDFQTGAFAPADPIPDWLLPLKARAKQFADLRTDELSQALIIRYDAGAGIGWHKDRPVFEHVVGIHWGTPHHCDFGIGTPRASIASQCPFGSLNLPSLR